MFDPKGISERDLEIAKLFYEFKYKTIMEAASKLIQISILFVSVSSVVTVVAVLKDLDSEAKMAVLLSAGVIVGFFCVIALSITYGIVMGLAQIRKTFKQISEDIYEKLEMDSYFNRGIFVVAVVTVGGCWNAFCTHDYN